MSNLTQLTVLGPKVEVIEALKEIMPACVAAASKEIGLEGVKAFFDGYRSSPDMEMKAA